jgi:hypothetical protein
MNKDQDLLACLGIEADQIASEHNAAIEAESANATVN